MHYIYLTIGILTEICGSTLLKFTDGFRKRFLAFLCLLAYGLSYYLVALSMKVLPLNIAYATVWRRNPFDHACRYCPV